MSNVNNFLPFCPTDTGTNLLSQSAYAAAANRTIGNQPGIASSNLVNKSIRQSTYVVGQLAQYISDQSVVDVLDDNIPAKLLSQIMGTFQPLAPVLTKYLSGSGSWNATYYFFIASGNATVGATYTNNAVTYTVSATIAAGIVLRATGSGDPSAGGGVLTKATGSGDATLTYYAIRKALFLHIRMVGGGAGGAGGGGGGGYNGGSGGTGGATSFGTTLLACNGGTNGGINGSTGGTASLGTGPVGIALQGGYGAAGGLANGSVTTGGSGAASPFGGNGESAYNAAGVDAIANTGSGGGGGSGSVGNIFAGGGGGAGGYVDAIITSPASTYAYIIGAAGTGGAAGTSGLVGGAGGSGLIIVNEIFQ